MMGGRLRAWIEVRHRPGPMAPSLGLSPASSAVLQTEQLTPQARTDDMELLTDMDRVRLVAGLGLLVHRAREMDPELVALLYKLSRADTQVWAKHRHDDSDDAGGHLTRALSEG